MFSFYFYGLLFLPLFCQIRDTFTHLMKIVSIYYIIDNYIDNDNIHFLSNCDINFGHKLCGQLMDPSHFIAVAKSISNFPI